MESIDKKYYKIREVSEIIGVPLSTLRFWEKEFTIIKPRRNEHGTRFYTASDIEKIRMVVYLVKEKGLKISAAQEQIKNNHSGVSTHARAVERLKAVRDELKAMLDAMNSLR
ncbi:MAG: MerR family transcriptional regulator [Muribaculum sp.]|nr:MerR family transcriptional regulator [Muribaculum sp.]